jgi:hypothetical protein
MAADFLYFRTDIRAILLDIFWNGTWLSRHGNHSPVHIGNIVKIIVPHETEK